MLKLLALAVAFSSVAALAQHKPKPGEPGLPPMNLPPGYSAKVQKTTVSYNFHGLTRDLPIPLDKTLLTPADMPTGVAPVQAFAAPTKIVDKFFQDPAGTLPSFGSPTRKVHQTFAAKGNVGTIVYLEYPKKLPEDMRLQLAKLFWNKRELLNAPQDVEFACTDNLVIVWNFKNAESDVKVNSQRKFFETVSEVATDRQNAASSSKPTPAQNK
jgi:hypothetical protein